MKENHRRIVKIRIESIIIIKRIYLFINENFNGKKEELMIKGIYTARCILHPLEIGSTKCSCQPVGRIKFRNSILWKKSSNGIKKLASNKKRKMYWIYLNDDEKSILKDQQSELGYKNLASYLRYKLLKDSEKMIYVDPVQHLKRLDLLGIQMAKIGNNINQLAKLGNQLKLQDKLSPEVVIAMNNSLQVYIDLKSEMKKIFDEILKN
ncbi:MAG: plasmid mobilization relaxosome protein MobC [Aequorivita sp.]